MRLTLVHPRIGSRPGQRYVRTWEMEPLSPALIAGLTPPQVQIRFHDDRVEPIPYDEPTDLVAMSVETYTARRAYQIASEYRRRGVPVVMGGFHATLCPQETARYAESVVIGEAERLWPRLLEDFQGGRLAPEYRDTGDTALEGIRYDRSIYAGKPYLPIGLVETGRGCRFQCDFCSVQSFFHHRYRRRPVDQVLADLSQLRRSAKLVFFVDDNFAGDLQAAKELLRALVPLGIRWVTQMSINAAHDEEFLSLLARAGCQGVLIGFESLQPASLKSMNKSFNSAGDGYAGAIARLRAHGIRVYATFVFGYDQDTRQSIRDALRFAIDQRFFITAFNHLTPFPGTPLYERLLRQGRMTHPQWWLDPDYRYNMVPFTPAGISADALQAACLEARREFFSPSSIALRGLDRVNRAGAFMFFNFFLINLMHRREIGIRNQYPLGDSQWHGQLIPAN